MQQRTRGRPPAGTRWPPTTRRRRLVRSPLPGRRSGISVVREQERRFPGYCFSGSGLELMECWLITSRAEVKRLEFGNEPPPEICLPDKPLAEIEDEAVDKAIQDAPYIIYRRYHLAHESWRLGIVYAIAPPTVGDIQILSAYRAGHESRPHLVDLQ